MLSLCKAYFWLNRRFSGNVYFEQTLRMLRFTVIGLIASAALMLMKPATFIDSVSWIIFAVVAFCTILPQLYKNKVTEIISHPILLIVIAGIAGYVIYA
jgi:chromate transport protein ChrA